MVQSKKLAKDDNINLIKTIINSIVKCNIILFGSRARGNFNQFSDYDIICITNEELDIKKKVKLSTKISDTLVDNGIIADVIIQSRNDIERKKKLIGSVVHYAIQEGVEI